MTMKRFGIVSAALLALVAAGCGGSGGGTAYGPPPSFVFEPIDREHAVFWDRQTTETAALLGEITARYNQQGAPLPVKIETTGDYGEIYQKVMASIRAKQLPAMAVSYESMTAQYRASGAAAALDTLIQDPVRGLRPEELADFYPAVLESNHFEEYGGATLSFPFTKSILMLYANHRVLRAAGIEGPPATWDEFLAQCRTIKAKTGKRAYAISVDCSTISGMIFSMGGEVLKGRVFQYDQPASVAVFELLETLIKEDLAYQIPARTFEDETAFAAGEIAFTIRTSAGSANMALAMGGKNDDWSVNRLPQADPARPAALLFGPNVTLFNVGAVQNEAAWAFVKYFTSPEVMAEWCLATGYVPFRKSVAEDARLQEYWNAWPSNRTAFDCLPIARTEPNVLNWQTIRRIVENAETAVITGLKSGREAAQTLQLDVQPYLAPPPSAGGGR
jgi:multiple sugar transport system substrate-binding protein